jgi:membrane protease YdiL (CAAX protease family)
MEFVISTDTALVFVLYACFILQFIFFSKQQKPTIALLITFGLVLLSWALELISQTSIPFISLLYLSAYCAIDREQIKLIFSRIAFIILAVLSLLFAVHKIPGFHNELIFSNASFGDSELPFQLYANLDKALAAIAILIAFNKYINWKVSRSELKLISLSILVFFSFGWLLGAGLDLKFGELTFVFFFFNLFVTCLAEEAFFRLLIQDKLAKYLPSMYSAYLAVFFTALIFMLAHFHTGVGAEKRLILIFLAGLLYGAIYLRSKSLGSAIVMHFAINIIHFSFFTYPATFSEF